MGFPRLLTLASAALWLAGPLATAQETPPDTSPPPHGHGHGGPFGQGPDHGHGGWWDWFKRPAQPGGPQQPGPDRSSKWPAERALMYTLAEVPARELELQLAKWPRFQQMSETEQRHFRIRLDQFRKGRTQTALTAARQLKLAIPPEREEDFTREFWRGRRKIEETLWREMEPRRHQLESLLRADLSAKYPPAPAPSAAPAP